MGLLSLSSVVVCAGASLFPLNFPTTAIPFSTMANTDLKNLDVFEKYLETRSYISGCSPSQSDVSRFEAFSSAPADKYVNVLRWYNNMASYKSEFKSLPGVPSVGAPAPAPQDDDDDDDVDLFGSDDEEEDAEAAKIREERLKAYAEKKSKKPGPIAKSQVLLDVKPWDDETDMKAMEEQVKSIQMEGLVWGACELKPLAFGIKKLCILCTVVDDLVSVDDLSEKIEQFEDYVQSVDVAAFNKV